MVGGWGSEEEGDRVKEEEKEGGFCFFFLKK